MMGVYIKGMEMPVIELEWKIRLGADGKWYAIDTNAETSDGAWHEIVPAADVVEVVHTSWVWNPDGMDWGIGAWVCGKCKSRPETWWNTVKECHPLRCSGSHYCGNCGAKMGGDL